MKWKVASISLVLLISIALAFTSEQETTYWDHTLPPKVTVPIEENGTPFNISITNWDTSSLKGKATISFPVWAPAGLASCTIKSKTVHLSYFNPPTEWASYVGSCDLKGSKIVFGPNGEKVDATIVSCPNVEVGDGVTTINVTCRDKAGQSSTASYKFIIDKMAPYIDPNTVKYDTYKIGTENSNFSPKIYFDAEDLSDSIVCTINFTTILGANYTYICLPTGVDGQYFGMKKFHMMCTPETVSIPAGFFSTKKNATIKCTDTVQNSITINGDKLKLSAFNVSSQKPESIIHLIGTMCTFGWENTPGQTLNTYGIYSPKGNSPPKDSTGLVAFVTLSPDSKPITTSELKQGVDKDVSDLAEIRQCAGGLAACSGLCALDIFTLGSAKDAAKQAVKEELEDEVDNLIESATRQLDDLEANLKGIRENVKSDDLVSQIDDAMDKLSTTRKAIREGKLDDALRELDEISSITNRLSKKITDELAPELKEVKSQVASGWSKMGSLEDTVITKRGGLTWKDLSKPAKEKYNVHGDLEELVKAKNGGSIDEQIDALEKLSSDLKTWNKEATLKPLVEETNSKIARWATEQANLLREQKNLEETISTYSSVTTSLEDTVKSTKTAISSIKADQKEISKVAQQIIKKQGKLAKIYASLGKHPYLISTLNPLSAMYAKPSSMLGISLFIGAGQRMFRRQIYYLLKESPYQYAYTKELNNVIANYFYIRSAATYEKGNPIFDALNQIFDSLVGMIPCGDLVVTAKQMFVTPDYPDAIIIYDKSVTPGTGDNAKIIQPGHTYLIQTRIERIDMSSGWPPVAEQVGECLFGCPDYACVVTIVPNQNEYK